MIEIKREKDRTNLTGFVRELIERENKVLSNEYMSWISSFIKRVETFEDEPNYVHYSGKYTQEEENNISLVSTLFSVISQYYDKNNIEHHVEKSMFNNAGVTVNLIDGTSIKLRLWCGQGAVTAVSLIEAGTGKVDIKDIVATFAK